MPDPVRRPLSSPLAACGALLAALAVVGLARGYELSRAPPAARPRAAARAAGEGGREVARLRDERPLDVNRASAEELMVLPRIGPTLASRIVEERERGGPYRSLADLARVRGIGPRTVEGLASLATAGEPESSSSP